MILVTPERRAARGLPYFARSGAALSAFGLVVMLSGATALAPRGAAAQAAPPAATPGVPVEVITAKRQDIPRILRGIGVVQANQVVQVRSRVDGAIMSVNFTEGQEVKAGDLLVQIDPRPYRAALNQAMAKKAADEATLVNAKLDLARFQETVARGIEARTKLDAQIALVGQLTATIQGDQAAIDTAQLNLTYSSITAPVEGRVGLRLIDLGNIVRAADPAASAIVTIAQIHPVMVNFSLNQEYLGELQDALAAGKPPVVAYASDGKRELSRGALQTIDNTVDTATGMIKMKAQFTNEDNRLWPGQFINATVTVGMRKSTISLPVQAVQNGPSGRFVFVIKPDSTVALTPVEVIEDDGNNILLGKGLQGGEQIVLTNHAKLQNGTRVAPRQNQPTS